MNEFCTNYFQSADEEFKEELEEELDEEFEENNVESEGPPSFCPYRGMCSNWEYGDEMCDNCR